MYLPLLKIKLNCKTVIVQFNFWLRLRYGKNAIMVKIYNITTFRALRHRNFRRFFLGQSLSLIGTWMQTVAQSWLVYRLTGSAALLGLVGFVSQIPIFLTSPFGGIIADEKSKRKVLLVSQCAAMILAFTLAFLTLSEQIQVWHILILCILLGVANGFEIPTRQSFVVEMVGKEDLLNAIALNSSMFHATRIIGPSIAGLIVASVGEGMCFLINAISYVAVIISLLAIEDPYNANLNVNTNSRWARLMEGARFVWDTKPVRALLILLGFTSLAGVPYIVLMPIFADKVLKSGAIGFGLLLAASGCGAVLGALSLANKDGTKGLCRFVALASICFGFGLVSFSFSRNIWLSAMILVPVGATMVIGMASTNTLIQTMTPDNLRGRVMSLYAMMFMCMSPFGALLAGIIGETLSAPFAVAIGGVLTIIGGSVFLYVLPKLEISIATCATKLTEAQQVIAEKTAEEATSIC